jgi:hypothetical protein
MLREKRKMTKNEIKTLLDEQTNKLEKRFDKTDDKLERVEEHCVSIDKTNIAQQKDIENHIKRTNLLEDQINESKKIVDGVNLKIEKHVSKHAGAYALLFISGLALGLLGKFFNLF